MSICIFQGLLVAVIIPPVHTGHKEIFKVIVPCKNPHLMDIWTCQYCVTDLKKCVHLSFKCILNVQCLLLSNSGGLSHFRSRCYGSTVT